MHCASNIDDQCRHLVPDAVLKQVTFHYLEKYMHLEKSVNRNKGFDISRQTICCELPLLSRQQNGYMLRL